jgi:hypothetical protein
MGDEQGASADDADEHRDQRRLQNASKIDRLGQQDAGWRRRDGSSRGVGAVASSCLQ